MSTYRTARPVDIDASDFIDLVRDERAGAYPPDKPNMIVALPLGIDDPADGYPVVVDCTDLYRAAVTAKRRMRTAGSTPELLAARLEASDASRALRIVEAVEDGDSAWADREYSRRMASIAALYADKLDTFDMRGEAEVSDDES